MLETSGAAGVGAGVVNCGGVGGFGAVVAADAVNGFDAGFGVGVDIGAGVVNCGGVVGFDSCFAAGAENCGGTGEVAGFEAGVVNCGGILEEIEVAGEAVFSGAAASGFLGIASATPKESLFGTCATFETGVDESGFGTEDATGFGVAIENCGGTGEVAGFGIGEDVGWDEVIAGGTGVSRD